MAASERADGGLTHLDRRGAAHMVGVGVKAETARFARAEARVAVSRRAMALLAADALSKGDALAVARIAGIAAAKRTAELVPLCHPLRITRVAVDAFLARAADDAPADGDDAHAGDAHAGDAVVFTAVVEAVDRTGVEMEAMTSAMVAALTLYDMVKAVDRAAVIGPVRLLEKAGGKSGHFVAEGGTAAGSAGADAPIRP